MKKLAIIFPGIGYTHDKPLLYYSQKIAKNEGYEIVCVEYHDLPENVRGDADKMRAALLLAYEQSCKMLEDIDFSQYEEILVIGKSLGTVVATKYSEEHLETAKHVLYTPVEATFRHKINSGIAFIGDSDSWSNLDNVKKLAKDAGIPLHIYPNCNHSLEVGLDCTKNIEILSEVMGLTAAYIPSTQSKCTCKS